VWQKKSKCLPGVFSRPGNPQQPGLCFGFCGAGNCELDLKAAARAAGERLVEMVPVSDIMPLTGYVKGGLLPHRH
jgi:hypothetical protein